MPQDLKQPYWTTALMEQSPMFRFGSFTSFPPSRRVRFAARADIRPMPAFMSTRWPSAHHAISLLRVFGESLPGTARQAPHTYRKHLCRAVGWPSETPSATLRSAPTPKGHGDSRLAQLVKYIAIFHPLIGLLLNRIAAFSLVQAQFIEIVIRMSGWMSALMTFSMGG